MKLKILCKSYMMDQFEVILEERRQLTKSYMQVIIGQHYLRMHMSMQENKKFVKLYLEEKRNRNSLCNQLISNDHLNNGNYI